MPRKPQLHFPPRRKRSLRRLQFPSCLSRRRRRRAVAVSHLSHRPFPLPELLGLRPSGRARSPTCQRDKALGRGADGGAWRHGTEGAPGPRASARPRGLLTDCVLARRRGADQLGLRGPRAGGREGVARLPRVAPARLGFWRSPPLGGGGRLQGFPLQALCWFISSF